MPIEKEFYFVTSVITIFSIISCVFLLPTKMNAKRIECRYKHNAKFSVHAKMSVITLSFIMNKVPSGQPGKLQINILIYSPCSISYRSLHLLSLAYFSVFFASSPYSITTKIIASRFTYAA